MLGGRGSNAVPLLDSGSNSLLSTDSCKSSISSLSMISGSGVLMCRSLEIELSTDGVAGSGMEPSITPSTSKARCEVGSSSRALRA